MLRLHVRELQHFVGLVHGHFIAGISEGCWAQLSEALTTAASPVDVLRAHESFVSSALAHCLLTAEGRQASSLINAVLALALSLNREVSAGEAGGPASVLRLASVSAAIPTHSGYLGTPKYMRSTPARLPSVLTMQKRP